MKNTSTPVLDIPWNILESIFSTIGSRPAESGGAMGASSDSENGNRISHFHFDKTASTTVATYSPDHDTLNRLFRESWGPENIRLKGFIHSHPGNMNRPSMGDEIYAGRILNYISDLEYLWLPIINTVPDTGQFSLTPWVAYRAKKGVSITPAKVRVTDIPKDFSNSQTKLALTPEIMEGMETDKLVLSPISPATSQPQKPRVDTTFDRVKKAYDLPRLAKSRVIVIGAGGAAAWVEDLARAGVGQFVLIDPDTVAEPNLATQQTYRKDIGRPKVDCIAERIRDINPKAKVLAHQAYLDDFDDEEIRRMAFSRIDGKKPKQTLICGLTDSFQAQARVNLIALNLGLPSLCAQVYAQGRAAEITFTYPGITPACHRCILSSRYQYFLDDGEENTVTSHGTPIFSTTRLNAAKGFVALGLLHVGSNHQRWSNMIERVGDRNFVQIRMDPDIASTLGIHKFDTEFSGNASFSDDVFWATVEPECPETGYLHCPDCGGTGDLRNAIGSIEDTRIIPTAAAEEIVEA